MSHVLLHGGAQYFLDAGGNISTLAKICGFYPAKLICKLLSALRKGAAAYLTFIEKTLA